MIFVTQNLDVPDKSCLSSKGPGVVFNYRGECLPIFFKDCDIMGNIISGHIITRENVIALRDWLQEKLDNESIPLNAS